HIVAVQRILRPRIAEADKELHRIIPDKADGRGIPEGYRPRSEEITSSFLPSSLPWVSPCPRRRRRQLRRERHPPRLRRRARQPRRRPQHQARALPPCVRRWSPP